MKYIVLYLLILISCNNSNPKDKHVTDTARLGKPIQDDTVTMQQGADEWYRRPIEYTNTKNVNWGELDRSGVLLSETDLQERMSEQLDSIIILLNKIAK